MNRCGAYRILLLTLCFVPTACGSSSPTSPNPTPTLSVAGTWSGTLARPAGDPLRIKSWTATQTGASVTGPMVIDVDGSAAEVLINTALTGTVSGAQITSVTFTVPVGALPDPSLAACGFSGTGTLAATASSISGPLAMSFPAACVGEGRISTTPTGTFTFSLTK